MWPAWLLSIYSLLVNLRDMWSAVKSNPLMLTADLADLQIWRLLKDCELSNLKNEGFWRFFLILPEPTHRADHRNVPRAPTKLIYYQSLFKNVGVGPTTKCHSCSTLPTLTNVEVARMIWYNNRRTTKNERVFLKHKSCYSFCRTTRDGVTGSRK